MKVSLRKFTVEDIPHKVRWINDSANNRFLHYDLPLTEQATAVWFERINSQNTRLDMTILFEGTPVGIAGLLQIDRKNASAEVYITVGEVSYKGLGIAGQALEQLLRLAFKQFDLERVFLLTEVENTSAIRAYEKFGFFREGCLRNELRKNGVSVSRYIYSMLKKEFERQYGNI